jgi:hypothetical protein
MKIAILYICTGRYNQFFADFYKSAKKYFLKDIAHIEYFVFTDKEQLCSNPDVHIIRKEYKGFPLDSLMRFDDFLSIKKQLLHFDYTFFFNANMKFVAPIGLDFLPATESLSAVMHPGYYNKPTFLYPYERNKKSTAYISPFEKDYHYFMGCLNGGKTKDYIELAETCSKNIHNDIRNGIMARFHDESHLNKYLRMRRCLIYSPSYSYPEGKHIPFDKKIIITDKTKIGKYFDKGRKKSLVGKIEKAIDIIYKSISWYF